MLPDCILLSNMSKVHILRALVTQRLTAAAEEILALFERTMSEYEEQITLLQDNSSTAGEDQVCLL